MREARQMKTSNPKFQEARDSITTIHQLYNASRKSTLQPVSDLQTRDIQEARIQWRVRLGKVLESTHFHVLIVFLLTVDLVVTVVDIVKTIHSKDADFRTCTKLLEDCQCHDHLEHASHWHFLLWVSVGILSFLALNVVGLMVAFGMSFFRHIGYVLDAVVVGLSLGLEIGLNSDTPGLLVLLTLWRIVRVAHGIFEVADEHWEKEIKKLEAHVHELEAVHKKDQEQIAHLSGQKEEAETVNLPGALNERRSIGGTLHTV
ncbi:voltage-gated hydrogen channel 1 [Marchantia polymorpha subsp. ruderalis]|uniref:Voltage-gated hydrogen channel 1 n=2 Tax=Marchantia polymorpha TaxID=3197 RepID=A0AAF6AVW8_MARPO|nr:hypothetical protein MARPO_0007s0045 [Marchantia polymorpha]BBN03902.1 hypothetical protein Mp_3g00490 [Marchantia polymorpha subsp. ruderalis]|eukprot:PTQ47590.1 hypothetical protein MARPO_0007s0045 [Marchantia polymorpha]